MATIDSEVLGAFSAELAKLTEVPATTAQKIVELLTAEKLPKAEVLAALYAESSGDALQ